MREPSSAPRVRQFATSARPPSIWKIRAREKSARNSTGEKKIAVGPTTL
jgi:hypothetical protein